MVIKSKTKKIYYSHLWRVVFAGDCLGMSNDRVDAVGASWC